jgi:protein-S-isoprenylcysteine O-methyltransferase Ste14
MVFAVATTAYIALAIQFEEHDLANEHGPRYQEYRRHVPMLLPRIVATAPAASPERATTR